MKRGLQGKALALLAAASLVAWSAHAQPVRLDDSTSPRSHVQSMQIMSEFGRPLDQALASGPPPQFAIVRFGSIEYRLATAAYVGRSARIFYVVPVVPGMLVPTSLKMAWRGGGVFTSGSARGGERTLVWSGVVREPMMRDSLDLIMEVKLADLRLRPGSPFSFESYFEIEVAP